jgi:predicted ATP-grasp superfamily ATP-dependent carboligase
MKVLTTTSRMPCAIDEIRKLGHQGHQVIATDTFRAAPGNHSKYVARATITASPRHDTARFIADVSKIVTDDGVDLLLPQFEEVFYLAKHQASLPRSAQYFFPSFEVLETLHDKGKLLGLARDLGVRVPRGAVVTSRGELADAIRELPRFFAKPVFSRGGVDLFTNTGPLAGAIALEECEPTPELPWIVQEFVAGVDVCTLSIAHEGRVSGHSAYVHPREIEHAGGIVFESVDEPECVRIAQRIVEATRYHGQISFDFIRTGEGMVLIECNPRPTAGVHLMSPEMFEAALLDRKAEKLRIVEPGVRRKYGIALVRDMLLHWSEAREDLRHLFSGAKEVFADPDDLLPALYQVLSYGHVIAYRRQLRVRAHKNTTLMAAYFADVCWNGEPISAERPDRQGGARSGGHDERLFLD